MRSAYSSFYHGLTEIIIPYVAKVFSPKMDVEEDKMDMYLRGFSDAFWGNYVVVDWVTSKLANVLSAVDDIINIPAIIPSIVFRYYIYSAYISGKASLRKEPVNREELLNIYNEIVHNLDEDILNDIAERVLQFIFDLERIHDQYVVK